MRRGSHKLDRQTVEFAEADRYGRQISILIMRANWEGAKTVIDQARDEAERKRQETISLDTLLSEINIETRTLNNLEEVGITTIEQAIVPANIETMLEASNVGWKTIDNMYSELMGKSLEGYADSEWRQLVLQQRYRVAGLTRNKGKLEERLKQSEGIREQGRYLWRDAFDDKQWVIGEYVFEEDHDGDLVPKLRVIRHVHHEELWKHVGRDVVASLDKDALGPFAIPDRTGE